MQNFDTELDLAGVTRLVEVRETTRTTPTIPHASRTHLMADGEWTWMQLRDYVTTEIERRFGTRSKMQHYHAMGTFKGFIKRWGPEHAERISRYVFESCDGIWIGKPVTAAQWCANSDPFFAKPIAERLSL